MIVMIDNDFNDWQYIMITIILWLVLGLIMKIPRCDYDRWWLTMADFVNHRIS